MGGDLHAWKGPFLWLHLSLSLARSLALRVLDLPTFSLLSIVDKLLCLSLLSLSLSLSLSRARARSLSLSDTLSRLQLSFSSTFLIKIHNCMHTCTHIHSQTHLHTHTHKCSRTRAHTSGAEQMENGGGPYTSCLKTTTPSQSHQTHRALPQSTIPICRNCLAPYSGVRPRMDCQGAVPSKMPTVCDKGGEGWGGGGGGGGRERA
jgi:hypothetical protein